MKKISIIGMGLVLCGLFSCGQRSNNTGNRPAVPVEPNTVALTDSTRLFLDTEKIESIQILFGDQQEATGMLPKTDYSKLAALLLPAEYDRQWNDSGIMVRMVTPDYTLIISYQDKTPDTDDWLMIWSETGRAKFRGKWFFVAEKDRQELYRLLDRFRLTE